jgi:hypothetical protein
VNPLRVTELSGGVRFSVHVQPRSKKPGVGGVHGDALKVRVSAAPVDGKANDAVIEMLAQSFGVATAKVRIVGGFGARRKVIEVDGVAKEAVLGYGG